MAIIHAAAALAGIGPLGGGVLDHQPIITAGRIYFVNSTLEIAEDFDEMVDAPEMGADPRYPFESLQIAFTACEPNRGDHIIIAPGHTETITTRGGLNFNVAGVTVVGLGHGSDRPRFEFTDFAASIEVSAPNVVVRNVTFRPVGIDVTRCFEVEATDFWVDQCVFDAIDTGDIFESIAVTSSTDAVSDGFHFTNNQVINGSASTRIITSSGDVDWLHVIGNAFMVPNIGDEQLVETTGAYTNLRYCWNAIYDLTSAAGVALKTLTDSTGFAAFNAIGHADASDAQVFDATGVRFFENYALGVNDASGLLLPAVDDNADAPAAVLVFATTEPTSFITSGSTFYVHSTSGTDDVAQGTTTAAPFATLDFAVGQCSANNGDHIVVMPGHAETLSTNDAITLDIAGVTITGVGYGSDRPAFTLNATDSSILVSADDVSVRNLLFIADTAVGDVTTCFEVEAANFQIDNCEFAATSSTPDFESLADLSAVANTADGFEVINSVFAQDGVPNRAINIQAGTDRVTVANTAFLAADKFTNATIEAAGDLTNMAIGFNAGYHTSASAGAELFLSVTGAASGMVVHNVVAHGDPSFATVFNAEAARFFENYAVGVNDASGLLLPAVTRNAELVFATTSPTSFITSGATFYVHSGTGADNAAQGTTTGAPFATIDFAVGQCTADQGDHIIVMPGHAETISSAGAIALDVAGVTMFGIGHGSDKPTITFDQTVASISVSASDVAVHNMRFVPSAAGDVTRCFAVEAADFLIDECEFISSSATPDFEAIAELSATNDLADRFELTSSIMVMPSIPDRAVNIQANTDQVSIANNAFLIPEKQPNPTIDAAGNLTNAAIGFNASLHTDTSGGTEEDFLTVTGTASGIVAHNIIGHSDATFAQVFDASGMRFFENYAVGVVDASALLLPAVTLNADLIFATDPAALVTSGNLFFVHSGTGTDDASQGTTTDAPFATIDFAIGQCSANQGDHIVVMPGHAETLSTNDAVTFDIAGVSVIGIGHGDDRPTFTLNAADASILVSASSVSVKNILFVADGAGDITRVFEVEAADFLIDECEFNATSATPDFEALAELSAVANTADRFETINSLFIQAGAPNRGIYAQAAVDRLTVANSAFLAPDKSTNATIDIAGDMTNVAVGLNAGYHTSASAGAEVFLAASGSASGIVVGNVVGHGDATDASVFSATGARFFENYALGVDDASGLLLPAVDDNAAEGAALVFVTTDPTSFITSGETWYVDSGSGNDGNAGTDPDLPLATLGQAITNATADNGDIIILMPGHSESIGSSKGIDITKSGLSVWGIGYGSDQPLFQMTAQTASMGVSAANIELHNINFQADRADGFDTDTAIEVDATDCLVENCRFTQSAAGPDFEACAELSATDNVCDRFEFINNIMHQPGVSNRLLYAPGAVDRMQVANNAFLTPDKFTAGGIDCDGALTQTAIGFNCLYSVRASDGSEDFLNTGSGSTGIVAHNVIGHIDATDAQVMHSSGPRYFENYAVGVDDASGLLLPAVTTNDAETLVFATTDPTSIITSETVYYVHSGTGNDTNAGTDPDAPFATWQAAIDATTGGVGDTIILMPGHAETIPDPGGDINLNKDDVTHIGIGHGSDRPTITYNEAADSINLTGASNVVRGIHFIPSGVDVTTAFNVQTGCTDMLFFDCSFGPNGIDDFNVLFDDSGTLSANRNDGFSVICCTIVDHSVMDRFVRFDETVDRFRYIGNVHLTPDAGNSANQEFIEWVSGSATNALIIGNCFYLNHATPTEMLIDDATTSNSGIVAQNLAGTDITNTTTTLPWKLSGARFFDNYHVGVVDASAFVDPPEDDNT